MRVYKLGAVPGFESMVTFHAMAHMGREGLVLVSPSDPLVSIGYFQDAIETVDLGYCKDNDIGVIRREVGGGAVLLDESQVFYQLVLRRDNLLAPRDIDTLYRKFTGPVLKTYRDLGIETDFRPINDVITKDGRKIAGEGGADIGDCLVFVGSIIRDFDYKTMVNVLRVPDEKFRDKMYKTMEDNLTTVLKETGKKPGWDETADLLIKHFAEILGPLEPAGTDEALKSKIEELTPIMTSDERLFKKIRKTPAREIRVREGVRFIDGMHKASGGLITAYVEVDEGIIISASITGDFTCAPKDSIGEMEKRLENTPYNPNALRKVIENFYSESGADTPGVTVDDLLIAVGFKI